MNLKTFRLLIFALVLFPSLAHSRNFYSLRVRPLALASTVYGGEVYGMTDTGYFIGSTFHYFYGKNPERLSAVENTEIGIRFGKVFQEKSVNQGWFLMGNLNWFITSVKQFNVNGGSTFDAKIQQPGEAFFGGYQWRALIIGTHWDLRLGVGMAYKAEKLLNFDDTAGNRIQIGVRKRFDPSLEYTMGYIF